jgi:hypothetical protein
MILYEKKDFDLIKYETRSIKRDMHVVGKEYKIERNVLSFVNKQNLPASGMKRKLLWEKISVDFEKIRHDVFEQQILRLFDFSAWVESKIKRVSLSETLMSKS